jgi:hypothetical protein
VGTLGAEVGRGLKFWRLQILLVGVAVAASGFFWLLQGIANPTPQVLFTFIIGNCNWLAVLLAAPLLKQNPPLDWIAFLGVLLPVAALASWISSVASRIVIGCTGHLLALDWTDIAAIRRRYLAALRSKRSRFITLTQEFTKSFAKRSDPSDWA